MRILEMTATFGGLEHRTLTLEPGLNVLEAPNEWGKSTWCAFLAAMLYGLDTRAKTTKNALADKEKYAPWSGLPMEGRIRFVWQGRDLTLERRTKGRVVLGEFRVWETESGLPVPELTAADCGEKLLGVEKSVFLRSCFIRLADLPVTDDESLRRRLNGLVTTGEESGTAEELAGKLKELKNRCRHHRTGAIPRLEGEQQRLREELEEQEKLTRDLARIRERMERVEAYRQTLNNHRTALEYARAREDDARVLQAALAVEQAGNREREAREKCAALPGRQESEQLLSRLHSMREEWLSMGMESEMLPREPACPEVPEGFRDMPPEQAVELTRQAGERYRMLQESLRGHRKWLWIPILLLLAAGVVLMFRNPAAGAAAAAVSMGLMIWQLLSERNITRKNRTLEGEMRRLAVQYGSEDPEGWLEEAGKYEAVVRDYGTAREQYRLARGDLDARMENMNRQLEALGGVKGLEGRIGQLEQVLDCWNDWENAARDLRQARSHAETIRSMAKTARPPEREDSLTFTAEETARLLSDCEGEQRLLTQQLGQCRGRMEAMEDPARLRQRQQENARRLAELEQMYAALEIALSTLAEASAQLQRRFAPRITAKAREIFARLTGDRYQRLVLSEDLSVTAGTAEEDTLRSLLWRSDGTVDQVYLALRLAVAGELTPGAPLILDDALVRFDDARLQAALAVLSEEGTRRQVLLFTCQSREGRMLRELRSK